MTSVSLWIYRFLSRAPSGLRARIVSRIFSDMDARRRLAAPAPDEAARPEGEVIWFHASTVSSVLAIQELTRQLADAEGGFSFVITTGSGSATRALEARMPEGAIRQNVPADLTANCVAFLERWRPDLCVWTGSRLRPRLMIETDRKHIPMIMLNARMTLSRFRQLRLVRGLVREMLARLRLIHVQDEISQGFFQRLGAPVDRLATTGTLRESSSALPNNEEERASLAEAIGGRTLWLAALTHPGEEEAIARAHREVLRRAPRALLILTPQIASRGDQIVDEYRRFGWRVAQRSKNEPLLPDTEVYVADTHGELGLWYRLAPTSFVGGSLADGDGHNPFEPAALGSAILHGPNVSSYSEIYDRLLQVGGSRKVRDADDLAQAVIDLLAPDQAATMAHAAWEVCSSGAAVTDRAITAILDTLNGDAG